MISKKNCIDECRGNTHPFRDGEKENFPNINDAFFSHRLSEKTCASSRITRNADKPFFSESNFFASKCEREKVGVTDEDKDRSTCSHASTFYDDLSVNLSIGARAALAEHRHFVMKYGFEEDNEENGNDDNNYVEKGYKKKGLQSSQKRFNRPEADEWDRIMEGNSFHGSVWNVSPNSHVDESTMLNENSQRGIHRSTFKSNNTAHSICETSDYFNSSKVNQLFTPEKNKQKVDEASRRALEGEGGVTGRGNEYENDLFLDESQIADTSTSVSAGIDESYLVGMLNAAARLNSSATSSSLYQSNTFKSFQHDEIGKRKVMDGNTECDTPSHIFGNSFNTKLGWENEHSSDFFRDELNDENIMPEGAFSDIGTSFLAHDEDRDVKEKIKESFVSESCIEAPMTPISKRQTSSYFESPFSSPKRGSPSQFNYLGISPMQGGLDSSVLAEKSCRQTISPGLDISVPENFTGVNKSVNPVLFYNDESPVSSIIKKSSSSERQKSSSSSSLETKTNSIDTGHRKKSQYCFHPKNSRAVIFEHGIEVVDSLMVETVSSSSCQNHLRKGKTCIPLPAGQRKDIKFTPETEDASLSPSYDYGRYTSDFQTGVDSMFGSSKKSDCGKMKPIMLLKSFESKAHR